jgi:hypothetical protein
MKRTICGLALGVAALLAGTQPAHAATFLGSSDTGAAPDAYACAAACPPGSAVGFRQFALRDATVDAPEDGVLVSASVAAKRIAGSAPAELAVLRPTDDGVGVTVVERVPVPVASPTGEVVALDDLRVPVRLGDAVGVLYTAGEVDLAVRARPRPDGAVQSFALPCAPCGADGGTGTELLFDAVVEPDVDGDGLGDESQDPDGGGLGLDWEEDWFDDYEEGDELDEDLIADASPRARRQLRLLDADRRRGRGATLLVRVPRAGRLRAAVTLPSVRRTGAGPFITILTGDVRARRAGRVRLRLDPTTPGARLLARRPRLRTKVVVSLSSRAAPLKVLMRSARL